MFSPDEMTFAPEVILFAASVALGTAMASLVGWGLFWLCRRREAPVRHAVLLTTIGICMVGPILLMLGSPIQLIRLRLPAPSSTASEPAFNSQAARSMRGTVIVAGMDYEHSVAGNAQGVAGSSPAEDSWSRFAASRQGVGSALLLIWLLGVLLGVANAFRGIWILMRFLRTLKPVSQPRLVAAVDEAFRNVGSESRARLFVTPFAPAPFSSGLFRPMIILPEYLVADTAQERLRYILIHEVAHVVRRDQWVALLQYLMGILYWWNPLLKRISRELSQAREEICDDYVLQSEAGPFRVSVSSW